MHREESLQWFLIKRFIYILVLVTIVQSLISMLITRVILPVIMQVYFPKFSGTTAVGRTELLFFLGCVLLILFFNAVHTLLPSGLQTPVQWMLGSLQTWMNKRVPDTAAGVALQEMEQSEAASLFLVFLTLMLFILLPYVLGAFGYAKIVIREFKEIQRGREEQQRNFDRQRNLMLSDIAHDLRTPMTTVSGYAKALADGMVQEPEKQKEYLDAIQSKTVRMNELINLLFEYVKLDSDGFTLDLKPVDLCELLRENVAVLYSDMESAGMTLDVKIPDEPMMVNADTLQLSRVVTNLLTNAIRHNPYGTRIMITTYHEFDNIYVFVADSGVVIPDGEADHLFEPFACGDRSRGSSGGSGLGLSIAKKGVEMHGWKLSLLQQPGIQHYEVVAGYAKAFLIQITTV